MKIISKYWKHITIAFLCLTPLVWFWGKSNILINGIDTNFPLNPEIWFWRRLFVWNGISNAGSDFSSSTAGMFFHLVQFVPSILGINLQLIEIISILFWFALIVISSYFFIHAILPKRSFPQLVFVVFYSFNIYLFNTWENIKVANLSLMAGIPLVIGALILLDKRTISLKTGIMIFIVSGFIVSGAGINPSYIICLFLAIFIYFIGNQIALRKNRKERLINFIIALATIVLVNAFWITPSAYHVVKSIPAQNSIDEIGFTNWIDSLSENTSIFNVLRLQGAWDWYSKDSVTGFPVYIPYALNYFYRFPFIVFSLVVPTMVLVSLIFRRKQDNHLYLFFVLLFIVGLFLSAGTHLPTGSIFRFLMDKIPFFSLFRSPWYIFTPLIIFASAGLVSLLVDFAYELTEQKKYLILNKLISIFVFVLLVGNLFYCYPLITGKIFRPQRDDSFFVKFPSYIFDAGKWLNDNKWEGRIISYPDDEIENFEWGYRGIDSILHLFTDREIIFLSLNDTGLSINRLAREFYTRLRKGELTALKNIAQKMGASMMFYKNDQKSLSPEIPMDLREGVESVDIGEWKFYKLMGTGTVPKIYSSPKFLFSTPYQESSIGLTSLNSNTQIINPNDSEIMKIGKLLNVAGSLVVAQNMNAKSFIDYSSSSTSTLNSAINDNKSTVQYEFDVFDNGEYRPILERYAIEDFGISTQDNLIVLLDNKKVTFYFDQRDDSFIFYKALSLNKGKHLLSFEIIDRNLISENNFQNINTLGVVYEKDKAVLEMEIENNNEYLSIVNKSGVDIPLHLGVSSFDPLVPYFISFKYRKGFGENGLVIVDQENKSTLIKSQSHPRPESTEWIEGSFYFDPVKTESKMRISLVAPTGNSKTGTKVYFDDIVVKKVFTNNLIFLKDNSGELSVPNIDYKKVSPVLYRGVVQGSKGSHVIIFSENYSPDWEIRLFDENGKRINRVLPHFSINLYANAWFADQLPENYNFEIFYKPQRLFNIGLTISGITTILGLSLFLFKKKK